MQIHLFSEIVTKLSQRVGYLYLVVQILEKSRILYVLDQHPNVVAFSNCEIPCLVAVSRLALCQSLSTFLWIPAAHINQQFVLTINTPHDIQFKENVAIISSSASHFYKRMKFNLDFAFVTGFLLISCDKYFKEHYIQPELLVRMFVMGPFLTQLRYLEENLCICLSITSNFDRRFFFGSM